MVLLRRQKMMDIKIKKIAAMAIFLFYNFEKYKK